MLLRGELILAKLLVLEPCVKHWCFRFDWLWAILNVLSLFDWQNWGTLLAQLNMLNVTFRSQVPMSNLLWLLISVCLYVCVCVFRVFHAFIFFKIYFTIVIFYLFFNVIFYLFFNFYISFYWYNFCLSYQFSTFFYLFSSLILIKNNQNHNKKVKLTEKQNTAYLGFIFSVYFIFVLNLSLETSMT